MTRRPIVLLLLLAVLCAPAQAAGELKRALQAAQAAITAQDADALGAALTEVVGAGKKAAAVGLLELLHTVPADRDQAYWQVARALGSLTDDRALDTLGRYLIKQGDTPQGHDVLLALQGNAAALSLYVELLDARKLSTALKLQVCDRLGELASVEAVDVLLEALEADDEALAAHARQVLVALVGEDMGAVVNWQGWWKQQRKQGLPSRGAPSTGTGTVVDRVDPLRRGALRTRTRGGRVVVVVSEAWNFDHIEQVLERMGVEHEVLKREAFVADPQAALTGTAALLVNCATLGGCVCPECAKQSEQVSERGWNCNPNCDVHDRQDWTFQEPVVKAIKDWVEVEGGALFSEDWGLWDFTGKAWPELIGSGASLSQRTVGFVPVRGAGDHPLLRGVFDRQGDGATQTRVAAFEGRWAVDGDSPLIRVLDPERVDVLLTSPDLAQDHPAGAAVAVAFSPSRGPQAGPGLVLHVLSHFGKQGSAADEDSLQNLLVNFLLEAQARFARR